MFRKVFKLLLVLIVSIMLIGCGAGEPSVAPDINDNIGSNEQIVIETTRKIYYTVDINIDTDDVNKSIDYFTQEAVKLNGYISNSNIVSVGSSYVTYKVPTNSLTQFLNYIDSDSNSNVTRKSISTNDITTKYNRVEAISEHIY